MGRKVDGSKGAKKKPTRYEKELADNVNELLTITTLSPNAVSSQVSENHKRINALIERIKQLEDKAGRRGGESTVDRASPEVLANFVQWLNENGGELNGCSISKFDGYDLGIRADRDVPESSLIITVPRKLVLSVENARESVLKELTEKIEILGNMPNVLLTIYLLVEKYSSDSFWKPYIDILPHTYSTVLYFSLDELGELKGSPTLDLAFNLIRSIARQYAYFFKLFSKGEDAVSVLMKKRFCFREYCWAVSTVMTRQNMIPSENGSQTTNALIPLWDLCNHTAGSITTDYNPEKRRCECLALKDFKAGEQIFIFYGPRGNAELFVHNGFVYDGNPHDTYPIRLGLSKSDPLRDKRKRMLSKLKVPEGAEFSVRCGEPPVDGALLKFLEVFNMSEERLNASLEADVTDIEDAALRKKCWSFLETRLKLLLGSYKTSSTQDSDLLREARIAPNARVAIRMRLSEKRLLENAIAYAGSFV